jgi:hypothetical protein
LSRRIRWPEGKQFAFTVFDDTDWTTINNGPEVYRFLYDLGIITTKSVWPLKGEQAPMVGGATCEDNDYLKWIQELKGQGFEIALHNATYHSSRREQAIAGLEQFRAFFGEYPKTHANHVGCEDSIYWGDARLSGSNKLIYNLLTRFRNKEKFLGADPKSEFFWGDKCKEHIKYVRNFVYSDINTLKACPYMPYFDEQRPFVNYWFAASEGAYCHPFCKTISEKNQDRLEEEGGACIMYTHFGHVDYCRDGRLNSDFRRLMERMSRKAGWFVPVSVLLDHVQQARGHHVISSRERNRLERKWLIERIFIFRGTT